MPRRSLAWILVFAAAAPASAAAETRLAVAAGVGVPDGATASLVVAPIESLRLSAGVGHNGISTGVQGQLALAPLTTRVHPTLTLGAGHFPAGDATPLARRLSGDATLTSPLLEEVGYDYATLQLGLELGRRRVSFTLHAGAMVMRGPVRGLEAELASRASEPGAAQLTLTSDPRATLWAASVRLGLLVYLSP